jgi:hypothetical protein
MYRWTQLPDFTRDISRSALLRGAVRAMVVATALGPAAGAAGAAPSADLWDRWTAHDQSNPTKLDHAVWDHFLKAYVVGGGDGINRIAYRWITAADASALDAYVARLEATRISAFSRAQQRAYWVNLYNALIVQLVLEHYPVASILDIDLAGGFIDSLIGDGPWQRKLSMVEGEPLSLDDIQHRILRPIWNDPRLHYAINLAALGCPNLSRDAYTAENAEAQLEAAARAFVNHPRGVAIVDDELVVSSLYLSYESDFGGDEVSVIAHLRRYAGAELSRALIGRTEIDDDQYDWTLNDIR